jgi:acetoacetyl-CoA synthetase
MSPADGGYFMPMFVVTEDGEETDARLMERITAAIKQQLSPRHVPDVIVRVPVLPRTLTGKKLEVPVKQILQGRRAEDVAAVGSVDRLDALAWFEAFAAGRAGA